jgi:hypothetical protein
MGMFCRVSVKATQLLNTVHHSSCFKYDISSSLHENNEYLCEVQLLRWNLFNREEMEKASQTRRLCRTGQYADGPCSNSSSLESIYPSCLVFVKI